jgi:hypothetical protein
LIQAKITHVDRTMAGVVTEYGEDSATVSVSDDIPVESSVAVTMRRPSDGQRVQILGTVIGVQEEGMWRGMPAVRLKFSDALSSAQASDSGVFMPPELDYPEADLPVVDGEPPMLDSEGQPVSAEVVETMAFFEPDEATSSGGFKADGPAAAGPDALDEDSVEVTEPTGAQPPVVDPSEELAVVMREQAAAIPAPPVRMGPGDPTGGSSGPFFGGADDGVLEAPAAIAAEVPAPPAEDEPGVGKDTMDFFQQGGDGAEGQGSLSFFSQGGSLPELQDFDPLSDEGVGLTSSGAVPISASDLAPLTPAAGTAAASEPPTQVAPELSPPGAIAMPTDLVDQGRVGEEARAAVPHVPVSFRLGGRRNRGEAIQLDNHGMFIATEALAKRGATIEMELPLRDEGGRVTQQKCTATVGWIAQELGRAPPNGFYAEIMSFKNAKARLLYEDFVSARQRG